MKEYTKQFINGKWIEGSSNKILHNINPYTDKVLYEYCSASFDDVNQAFISAHEAFITWSLTPPNKKQALLEQLGAEMIKMKDDIYSCLIEEGGATYNKCDFEYHTTIDIIKQFINYPFVIDGKILLSNTTGRDNYIFKKPKGVIGVIVPWNVPILLAMRSVIPAIAVGNSVVLKPSSETPASAFLIAELFEKSNFPKGLLNVVAGTGHDIGNAFIQHPLLSMISFTGSTKIGKHIGECVSSQLKDISLELGGNNTMLVLDDANIEYAAKSAAFGAFFHQGQICMAINRIIATKNVYKNFLDAFIEETKKLKVGSTNDADASIGPLINKEHRLKVENYINDTIAAGAKIVLKGKTEDNFISPWILDEVLNEMPAASNEVFGPVCCVIIADDEEEAIKIANNTQYGLSASVFTNDRYHGMQIANQLAVGMVHINDQTILDEPHVMFGGEKESGIGRFNGKWIADSMMTEKWISVQTI